jgi:5'-nucleotidase
MKSSLFAGFRQMFAGVAGVATLALLSSAVQAEPLTILHVGDQESWLISAQGNLRDDNAQLISFYGGVDRLAAVITRAEGDAALANRFVIKLNAGDALLPGPRLEASFSNLATAYPGDNGQDFYDAIALRKIGFHAVVFGNHEFDLGADTAARFAKVSETSYLSINLNFGATPEFTALQIAGKVAPSKIITTPLGKKVGVIGVTTPLLPTISSPGPVNLTNFNPAATELANLQALIPVIQAEINRLRTLEGVTVVVMMSHLQNAQNERTIMIPALDGVDLVVSGGGHELMTDPADQLINGGVAATFTTHPIYVNDVNGTPTPLVTSHFGNRYVGEVNLTIDDGTGLVTAIDSTRMLRVSGRATDADVVVPDAVLNTNVVTPVRNFIAALNAQIIGTTAVALNGPTHAAGTPGNYTEGVRNAETGLGNLVADAMRFAGTAQVSIQNGGGIRTNVAGPGNVSVGDTFNVLPFTNLVKRAPVMTATQLKDLLEHSVAASNPSGLPQGRFAQVSGIKVNYDTTQTARTVLGTGSRIRRVVLDNGAVLIDGGVVQAGAPTFSFATIDFTANGGDGYPFAANGVVFENSVYTITYQQALADYIQVPKALGGLGRVNAADGDEITANLYGEENAFDTHGRLIDNAVAVATPGTPRNGTAGRDTLVGDANDNVITGGASGDTLTGGAGGDTFVYVTIRDIGDTITDFTPYADKLSLGALLTSIGYAGSAPVADGYIKIADTIGGAVVQIDIDGAGPAAPRPIATLRGLTAAQLAPARDFSF